MFEFHTNTNLWTPSPPFSNHGTKVDIEQCRGQSTALSEPIQHFNIIGGSGGASSYHSMHAFMKGFDDMEGLEP